jgi:hypothetical protein
MLALLGKIADRALAGILFACVILACAVGPLPAMAQTRAATFSGVVGSLKVTTTLSFAPGDVVLRRSAAKTLKIDTDGAASPLTLVDVNAQEVDLMVPNNGILKVGGNSFFIFNTRSSVGATADKLLQVVDNTQATGTEINNGTPTLGTCTGGTLTSGSHNIAGEVTGNTSGSCVLNFGTPNFTNTPVLFCE